MASDYQNQRRVHPHPLSHAIPGDWFPGDTTIAGNECARITSAKLLRKSETPWCVTYIFLKLLCSDSINIIKYQVTKWCQVWLTSFFDSLFDELLWWLLYAKYGYLYTQET